MKRKVEPIDVWIRMVEDSLGVLIVGAIVFVPLMFGMLLQAGFAAINWLFPQWFPGSYPPAVWLGLLATILVFAITVWWYHDAEARLKEQN